MKLPPHAAHPAGDGRDAHCLNCPPSLSLCAAGWDQTAYYNDLWAFDFDSFFRSNRTCNTGAACWKQVIPNGVTGMPPPRNSFR